MASRDLFRKPFDEGTAFKLKIFQDYFAEWLPVFIAEADQENAVVQIFDFFAGAGKDLNNEFGSPLLILSILNRNKELIVRSKVKVNVILNEYNKRYYEVLKQNCNDIVDPDCYSVVFHNEDFSKVFDSYYPSMATSANFLFLDQNGIKHITTEIFNKITSIKRTDFIFFISSSYIKRFFDEPSFARYLNITKQSFEGKSYYHIHRIVLDYYRSLIPKTKTYYLAPFSIKKPAGIYGLVFGSNHTYGLEKFLRVCWKHDQLTGEANYDIDNERIDLTKPSLFEEYNVPSKRQVFEKNLKEKILSKEVCTDVDVYVYALEEGFLPKDANKLLKELQAQKMISFDFKLVNSKIHKIIIADKIKVM